MRIKAYAKINMTLKVLGLRPDGFHEMETLMQAVMLHDDVDAEWTTGGDGFEIRLKTAFAEDLYEKGQEPFLSDGPDNLAYRAAVLTRESLRPDVKGILKIRIEKHIPVAAGLAGGSSNAAAVLTALKAFWNLTDEELLPVAARLGSDVPFSYMAQNGYKAAIGRGRGTELEANEGTIYNIVLSNPGFGVSTPMVYKEWDKMNSDMQLSPAKEQFFNDLQEPALRIRPEIQKTIDELWSLEPKPLHVQLSGSGPTVFAVYPDGTLPERESLASCRNKITILTRTL